MEMSSKDNTGLFRQIYVLGAIQSLIEFLAWIDKICGNKETMLCPLISVPDRHNEYHRAKIQIQIKTSPNTLRNDRRPYAKIC